MALKICTNLVNYTSYVGKWLADRKLIATIVGGSLGYFIEGDIIYSYILRNIAEIDQYSPEPTLLVALPFVVGIARGAHSLYESNKELGKRTKSKNKKLDES